MPRTSLPNLPGLAPEIRMLIYRHIFADSHFWIDRDDTETLTRPVINAHASETRYQIALTCRLFYREARLLWYASTVWTFEDQHMLRLAMIAHPILHENVKHLHILDLDGESPVDWLSMVPSLTTLTVRIRWQYEYSTRHSVIWRLYGHAEKSLLEDPADEFNPGIGRIYRLKRDFELSVLFTVCYRVDTGDLAWHLAHMNLDTRSLTLHEYSIRFRPDRIPDALALTKRILSDYVEQHRGRGQETGIGRPFATGLPHFCDFR